MTTSPVAALPLRAHLRAAGVLMLYLFVGVLGTPGLDLVRVSTLSKPADREAVRRRIGDVGLEVAELVVAFNREVRLPLADRLGELQRPFRISQNWSLYRDGPGKYWRLDIYVDGELRHRSLDPEHDWLAREIRSRKLRPMMEATVQEDHAPNAKGFVRLVGKMAERDFPGARHIELQALRGDWPGTTVEVHHALVADAPEWVAQWR